MLERVCEDGVGSPTTSAIVLVGATDRSPTWSCGTVAVAVPSFPNARVVTPAGRSVERDYDIARMRQRHHHRATAPTNRNATTANGCSTHRGRGGASSKRYSATVFGVDALTPTPAGPALTERRTNDGWSGPATRVRTITPSEVPSAAVDVSHADSVTNSASGQVTTSATPNPTVGFVAKRPVLTVLRIAICARI